MKNTTFLIFLLLGGITVSAQELVNSVPLEPKKNRDVFQIIDDEKNTVTLFVSDTEKVKAINLNEKMQIIDSISANKPNTTTTNVIGYNSSNTGTRLYWSSNNDENIFVQLYDFNNHKTTTNEYNLILKNEKVIQKFSENEKFYILAVLKNSNTFKLYVFDKEGIYTEKIIPSEGFHFFTSDYKKSDLYEVFAENLLPFESPFSLENITIENHTSLTKAAKKRKCYLNNKQIVITVDTNIDFTQVILIDLNNFTATEKMVKKPYLVGNRTFLNSNSFYFDNKLYQIKTSSGSFYFTIKDLEDNLIKEYFANTTIPIKFKNSEIYEGGGNFRSKRTLPNSNLFILKANNMHLGLSCYQTVPNTLITFGGVSDLAQSTDQIDAVLNPKTEVLYPYSDRKLIKIEGLFDGHGNHVKGKLQPLAFEKISTFLEKNTDISSQTLFKTDAYYLGYYDNKTKEYVIRKFTD
ncbi:hypothetical protein DMB65_14775 [Flavobacterium cheongpyeongense]|uniref:Uncharacterized protein n=1 Tax=Flavobacterium cheongpyeongense TaxID=2212651 RepID=A0A2V4BQZ1_9FLAO|nr:hypothetical protein [Flavobacterium cheongpyeongense]PXY40050.1 hypothetical protein DMB65_14775 [Flavobacterium cheongpyeongense]